jgi:hypothetical protein
MKDYRPEGGEDAYDVLERSIAILNENVIKYVQKDYIDQTAIIRPVLTKNTTSYKKAKPTKSKTGQITQSRSIINTNPAFEYESISDLDSLFSNFAFNKQSSRIFKGFDPDLNIPRILLISHGLFIANIINAIRAKKNLQLSFTNDILPSSLTVIRIYCSICGSVCYSKSNCRLEFDLILYNNVDHLGKVI